MIEGSPIHRPISGREYAGWKRLFRRYPFGVVAADLTARAAVMLPDAKKLPTLRAMLTPARRGRQARKPFDLRNWVLMQGGKVVENGVENRDRVVGDQALGGEQ